MSQGERTDRKQAARFTSTRLAPTAPASRHDSPTGATARLTVSQLAAPSDERANLDDFLSWSAQRRWSGASLRLDPSRRDAWLSAVKTLGVQHRS